MRNLLVSLAAVAAVALQCTAAQDIPQTRRGALDWASRFNPVFAETEVVDIGTPSPELKSHLVFKYVLEDDVSSGSMHMFGDLVNLGRKGGFHASEDGTEKYSFSVSDCESSTKSRWSRFGGVIGECMYDPYRVSQGVPCELDDDIHMGRDRQGTELELWGYIPRGGEEDEDWMIFGYPKWEGRDWNTLNFHVVTADRQFPILKNKIWWAKRGEWVSLEHRFNDFTTELDDSDLEHLALPVEHCESAPPIEAWCSRLCAREGVHLDANGQRLGSARAVHWGKMVARFEYDADGNLVSWSRIKIADKGTLWSWSAEQPDVCNVKDEDDLMVVQVVQMPESEFAGFKECGFGKYNRCAVYQSDTAEAMYELGGSVLEHGWSLENLETGELWTQVEAAKPNRDELKLLSVCQ